MDRKDFEGKTPEEMKNMLLDMLIQQFDPTALRTVEVPVKEVRFIWEQLSRAGMALLMLTKMDQDEDTLRNLKATMSDFVALIPGEPFEISFENKDKLLTVLVAAILASADQLAKAAKLEDDVFLFSQPDELAKKIKRHNDEQGKADE